MSKKPSKAMVEVQGKYDRFADIPPFVDGGSYQVNIGWDYLESSLARYGEGPGGIEMDPDFQRAHVWTELQQIRYVEFRLRGGRSGRDIYWNCSSWMKGFDTPVLLVDGKQRIEAVRRFMRNEIPAFGTLFGDYQDKLRPMHVDFIFHVNNLETRAEVLQWYIDLNAGGVAHTDEEIERVRALLDEEAGRDALREGSR